MNKRAHLALLLGALWPTPASSAEPVQPARQLNQKAKFSPSGEKAPKAPTGANGHGEIPELAIARSRVLLEDLVPMVSSEIAEIDLGPTPVPGSSRLIKREDVLLALSEAGADKLAKLPKVVRVVRKTKQLSVVQQEKLARDAAAKSTLSRGATFAGAKPKAAISVPDGYDAVTLDVPRPPRREGKHSVTATMTFLAGDEVVAKVPLQVELKLSKEAAVPDVKKGEKVLLVVKRGLIEIRASASAQADADVGEMVKVTVNDSGKVLKGLVKSASPAIVLETP